MPEDHFGFTGQEAEEQVPKALVPPTEEDAIRRLRSTLIVSIGLTPALGLAASRVLPAR